MPGGLATWWSGLWRSPQPPGDTRQLDALLQGALDTVVARQARGFDAAESPHFLDSWTGAEASINDDLARQLPMLVKRSRDLARNNDWARRFLIQLRNNVLGSAGVRVQVRLAVRGKPRQDTNDAVESAFKAWGRRGVCEVTGRFSWTDIERIGLETLARDGEVLIRFLHHRGPHGLQLQLLSRDVLDVTLRRDVGGRRIRMGVEIDAENRPVAYHILARADGDSLSPYSTGARTVRVPADEILHIYVAEEFDQLRGYPWLTPGARRLRLVSKYEEAASVAATNAASRLGFFVSPNGEAPPGIADQIVSASLDAARAAGRTLSPDEIKALSDSARKLATTVPGQFDTLPQGYDFRPYESEYPHKNYGDYVKECLRGFTAGQGISYVTGGNNLEAVNLSSARVGITDERETYRCLQAMYTAALHQRVTEAWLPHALLRAPQLAKVNPAWAPDIIDATTWMVRRWPGIDPLKEAQANELNLRNRLTSRRRIITERGDDPDEIAAEVEQEPPLPDSAPSADDDGANDNQDGDESESESAAPRARLYHIRAL